MFLLLYNSSAGACSHCTYISGLVSDPIGKKSDRKLLQTENCLSKIIHLSKHGDLIWFCQSFLFFCYFIALEFSVFISVLHITLCSAYGQFPDTHTRTEKEMQASAGKWSLKKYYIQHMK